MRSVFKKKTMKHTLFQSLVFSLLFFTTVPAAADITHNFKEKAGAKTLVYVDATHYSSTDDDIVYTLSGAAFGIGTGTSNICLNLFSSGNYATVSPAFHNLHSIEINYLPSKELSANLLIQISTNGSSWSTLTPTGDPTKGHFIVNTPTDGDYYVKILRSGGENISISQITYTFSDCNCFTYTPE